MLFLTDRTLLTAMKNKVISLMSGLAMVAGLAVGPAVLASNSADVTKALAGSTALELPAKAANLVAKASTADKKNVAVAARSEERRVGKECRSRWSPQG